MSVRRRQNWLGQQRADTPHIKSIESATSNDFDELLSGLVIGADKTYVNRGLEISMAGAIGSSSNALQLLVADSSVLHGGSDESGTFYVIPTGTVPETLSSVTNDKVDGSFTPSTDNYIGFEFSRAVDDATVDQVYFWSQTTKTEFTKTVPLAVILDYKITINTSAFPSNVLPLAVVRTDSSNNVVSVTDRRPMLFRLGSAGFSSPNPFYSYPWTNHTEGRTENFYTSTSSTTSPFRGGDKQIKTLKEWMDAVMTSFKEVKGSAYWYTSATVSGGSILRLRQDTANTVFTGRGSVTHSASTSGLINWSSDIFLNFIGGSLRYKIKANPSTTDITLGSNEVAYIQLVRGATVVPNLIFTNGSAVVTSVGAVSWTTSLQKGDFVKIASEDDSKYYEIFSVDSTSQVTLTEVFAEASTGTSGRPSQYAWGVYETSPAPSTNRHVKIADRGDVPFGEDYFWLMFRQDDLGGTPKVYIRFLGSEIESGEERQISDNTSEGILSYIGSPSEGRATPDYGVLGTEEVTYIYAPFYGDITSGQAFYLWTADDRTTAPDESLQHYFWFDLNGDGITDDPGLSGTGHPIDISTGNPSFTTPPVTDADEVIYRENIATEMQLVITAVSGLSASVTDEVVTVTTTVEGTVTDGSNVDVGGEDFRIEIGIEAVDTYLDNQTDYGSNSGENLTKRVARLTAMMSDKAQDRTIKFAANYNRVFNTTNGSLQEITFENLGLGSYETTTYTFPVKADLADGQYFTFYSANDATWYYAWCDFVGDLSGDPMVVGATAIPVDLSGATTAAQVAAAFDAEIDPLVDFTSIDNLDGSITVTTTTLGSATNADAGTMGVGFIIDIEQNGADVTGPDTLTVVLPSSPQNNLIELTGTLSLLVNQSAYFRVDRNLSQTIDLTDLQVANTTAIPLEENVFIFAYRLADNKVYLWNNVELDVGDNINPDNLDDILNGNAYEEDMVVISGLPSNSYEVQGPVLVNTLLTLPIDSKDGNPQEYVVGKGVLELYLNGQFLDTDGGWEEIGTGGSISDTVRILLQLEIDDVITFRIDTAGGYVTVGSGGSGGGEANTASNAGTPQDADIFKQKTGVDLELRRIKAGSGINVIQTPNYIEFEAVSVPTSTIVTVNSADLVLTSLNDVVLVICGGSDRTITLPDATTVEGKIFDVKMLDGTANVNIATVSNQTIDDVDATVTPLVISTQYDSQRVVSDGTNYWLI